MHEIEIQPQSVARPRAAWAAAHEVVTISTMTKFHAPGPAPASLRFEIFDSQEGPNAKCIIQKKKLAKQEAAVVELLVWEASWLVLLHF